MGLARNTRGAVRILLAIVLAPACDGSDSGGSDSGGSNSGGSNSDDGGTYSLDLDDQGKCSNLEQNVCLSRPHCQVAIIKTGIGSLPVCLELHGGTTTDAAVDAGCTPIDGGCYQFNAACADAGYETCRTYADCIVTFWSSASDTCLCPEGPPRLEYRGCAYEPY